METLRRSLTMLVALSVSFSAGVAHARHNSRNHNQNHVWRQGSLAGIQMIASPGGPIPTDPLPSQAMVPGSVITAAPIRASTANPTGNRTDLMLETKTTETFPITIMQIPVASVCPANHSNPLPIAYTISPINTTTTPLNNTNSAHPLLNSTSSFPNATFPLPIPANTSRASPTATLADPNARISLGDNGCQTLFTPVTTAICRTVLSIGGQLPISVTDCGQWVTFSSSPLCGGAASTEPAGGGSAIAYFLAPWHEIASGAVPAEVQVQTCSSVSGTSGCVTGSESWTVSTATVQGAVTQTARFFGGAVGPLNLTLVPNLLTISIPSTATTTLSIDTTITTLSPHAVPTILRQDLPRLGTTSDPATPTTSAENTVTTTIQVPVTTIYSLEAVAHHTTVTVTVEGTLTSLVVVAGSGRTAKSLP